MRLIPFTDDVEMERRLRQATRPVDEPRSAQGLFGSIDGAVAYCEEVMGRQMTADERSRFRCHLSGVAPATITCTLESPSAPAPSAADEVPLVRGGQGRADAEAEELGPRTLRAAAWIALVAILALLWLTWGRP